MTLALRNQPQLEAFIAQVSDRKSPNYGHYLTPDQFVASYGPTQLKVQQVVDHLRTSGLSVGPVSSNRTIVDATGPVSAVEAAFGVTISDWHDRVQNRDFFGNDTEPTLPPALASYVVGVAGLNNHYPLHRLGSAPKAPPGGGPAGGYTPNELKKAYNVTPLATAGYTGNGQALGLFELDGFRQSNITTYDTHYGLGSPAPAVQMVDGGPGPLGMGEIEVELDIEVDHAVAPSAMITVYEGPNTLAGANDTYNAMVTSNTTKANSTSWGLCEPNMMPAEMDILDNIFKQAASQGQSFYAASGDNGAYDCGDGLLGVDSPANDPYMTGTGGTNLTLNGDGTYKTESAWSNPNAVPTPLGSGGGLSTYFARPSWQTGPGVANTSSNGMRQVPDISSVADPNTGYSVYVTSGGTGWTVVGGTSGAAPSWAAFTALYNQYAAANGKPNLGYANPTLYTTGSNPQPNPPYHDVTTGNNLFYSATANWDYATGWGSYNAYNFALDLVPKVATSPPANWSTYHHDLARSGYDSQQPTFSSIASGWGTPTTVDGSVYAEPLVVGSTVIVATENNSLYALSLSTGSVLWRTNLGPPVPNASLPCGNVDPVGITGTPVIDQAAGMVYVVGLVQPPGQAMAYQLAAINLANGNVTYQVPINVTGLDPQHHGQRAALTLNGGTVYIPFGGRWGDCTPYHGWLVAAPASTGGPFSSFQTSVNDGGGLWQPGGAPVDTGGNLYVTSGNTFCTAPCPYDGGETVFKLSPSLQTLDYFAPTNWSTLNAVDMDLGSTNPQLLDAGLVFQAGKSGDGFLLNQGNLGQIGGQAFTAHVCPGLTDDATLGADAYVFPYIYVPCRDGLVAIKIDTTAPSFAFAWKGPAASWSGPPIVAAGLVWTLDPAGTLYALNPSTGATAFTANVGAAVHFATPAAGGGAVFVAAGSKVFSFISGGPTLTSVQASNINSTSAVTTWQTDRPANSRVDYGRTTSYGSSVSDSTNVTIHSLTISGLANNATYHYKVTSTDANGKSSSSSDATFTTYTNLLSNGGFEVGMAAWNSPSQATIDSNPADAHAGNNSLQLVATSPYQLTGQTVAVTPGQTYSFNAFGRSSNPGGVWVLESHDASGAVTDLVRLPFAGTGSWIGVAAAYKPAANVVSVIVYADNTAAGTFWFDDANLAPTTNLLTNGGFELGMAGWNAATQATIDSNPANAHGGNNSLQLVATGPYQLTGQTVAVIPGQTYSFNAFGRSSNPGGVWVLESHDASGAVTDLVRLPFAGTGSWIGVAAAYKPVANVVSVFVYADNTAAGTFWFDDANLAPTTNLLTNGGFEVGMAGWNPASQATIDSNPANAHAGNNSLQLVATGPYQLTGQTVAVTPGQTYSFNAFGRSSNPGGVWVLESHDASGAVTDLVRLPFAGTGSWIGVAAAYKPAANVVSVIVYADNTAAGTFWFDDANLAPTTNLLTNTGFEVGSAGWTLAPQATIDGNPADAHSGNNSLQLVATGPYQLTGQTIAVTPGQTYSFSGFGRSSNSGGMWVLESRDASGAVVSDFGAPFVGTGSWIAVATTYRPASNVVSLVIFADNSAAGAFWFDDASLTKN